MVSHANRNAVIRSFRRYEQAVGKLEGLRTNLEGLVARARQERATTKTDLWIAVFVQENPEDRESCLAEVRSYVFGGDLGPRDLGVDLDATKAVYEDDQIPWARAWYEGPEPTRLRSRARAE